MHSMTGYGRGEASNGDVTVVVEMKSVNNRFRDINLRVPREYLLLEPRLIATVRDRVQRGRIDLFVRRSAVESGQTVEADPVLAERYLRAMREVAQRLQRLDEPIPLTFVLEQPGVLQPADPETDPTSEWNLLETAVEAALTDFLDMRASEGGALQADLRSHLDQMQRLWADVQAAADGVNARLKQKLEERVQRLLGDRIDPGRLAQEAAILADKADISEELARILSHCRQFSDALGADEPTGRKLEFLVQELNREINTVGSKAAEHPIAAKVVDMKSVLERMKEQAANVE